MVRLLLNALPTPASANHRPGGNKVKISSSTMRAYLSGAVVEPAALVELRLRRAASVWAPHTERGEFVGGLIDQPCD